MKMSNLNENLLRLNLNSTIRFKLTDKGRELHKYDYDEFWSYHSNRPTSVVYRPLEEDEEGYSKMQLWDFMNIFGKYIILGCELPVEEANIFIKGSDLIY